MSCVYNLPYSIDCMTEFGGVQKVIARNYSGSTVWTYDTDGNVTGTTANNSWYQIEQRSEQGELLSEGAHSQENGTNVWTYTLNLNFDKYDAALRNMIYVMAQKNLEFIVYGNNGSAYLFGSEFGGAYMSASNPGLGKALSDKSGSNISFVGKHGSPIRLVSSTLLASLTIVS